MIRRIQAINYRSLKHIDVTLGNFHVLVGPNASGKSTVLSVLSFLSDLVSSGLDAAIQKAGTEDIHDLVWGRTGNRFELGVEAEIPAEHRSQLLSPEMDVIRYQVAIGLEEEFNKRTILQEWIVLGSRTSIPLEHQIKQSGLPTVFQSWKGNPPSTRLVGKRARTEGEWVTELENPTLFPDDPHGFYDNLIPDSSIFKAIRGGIRTPVSMWLGNLLRDGICCLELQSDSLRRPTPPGMGNTLLEDGSNLPWVVDEFQKNHSVAFGDWIAHLRTALPDLQGIRVIRRPEDHAKYIMLQYVGGLEVPSWMVSDGTLRLLALTILAYLPGPKPIYLIEEPENSIHPTNVETVMQSLQSVYDGQVLVTTHSPAVLAMTDPSKILVFSRDEIEGTQIVTGDKHPALQDWKGEVSLGTLFAGGVLG